MIGRGTAPLLSPNGRLVAASTARTSGSALELISSDGSATTDYFDASRRSAAAVSWSSDSRYVAVSLASTDPASNASSGLAVIDTRSRTWRLLARGTIYGASFDPASPRRLAYAVAFSQALTAPVDIHMVNVDGSSPASLTHDGRSLYPVWGRRAVAFDREQIRSHADPINQIWLMTATGELTRQVTHIQVPPLHSGLVPLGFSHDGSRLLAEYVGTNTSRAWAIDLDKGTTQQIIENGHSVSGSAISRDGSELLVDQGGFLNPPDSGRIETIPFLGGRAHTLVPHGSSPSWDV